MPGAISFVHTGARNSICYDYPMRKALLLGVLVGFFAVLSAGILLNQAHAQIDVTDCKVESYWIPDASPWHQSGGTAFTYYERRCETFSGACTDSNPNWTNWDADSCTTGGGNGATCTVKGHGDSGGAVRSGNKDDSPYVCRFPPRTQESPANQVDNTDPVCGTWTSYDGQGNITLYGSTDAGGSGINISGGSCNSVAEEAACTVTISDNAGNTKNCTSTNRPKSAPPRGPISCTANDDTSSGHHIVTLQVTDQSVSPQNSSTYNWTMDKSGDFDSSSGVSVTFHPTGGVGFYKATVINGEGAAAQCTFRINPIICSTDIPAIYVSSNIATTWVLTGPETITQSAVVTEAHYPGKLEGTYTLTPGQIAGYSVAIAPASTQFAPGSPHSCSPGASATYMITYAPLPGDPPPLSCTPANQSVDKNENVSFGATGGSNNYNWTAPSASNFSGSGPNFTTSYAQGGSYTVTVSDGASNPASCSVSVCNAAPRIDVLPANNSIYKTQQATYNAQFTDSCGVSRMLNPFEPQWTGSDASVASSNGDGTYTGVNQGNIIVTATYGGTYGTANLRVLPPALGPDFSCSISPDMVDLYQGEAKGGTITCTPVDGFTGSITLTPMGLPSHTTMTTAPVTVSIPPSSTSAQYLFTAGDAADPGTYPSIKVRAQGGNATHDIPFVATIRGVPPTLDCDLSASPFSVPQGQSTTFTATCGGTEIGTLNYSYWANSCVYRGTSVAAATAACGAPDAKHDASLSTTDSVPYTYGATGSKTGMVIVERGGEAVQALAPVTVTQSNHGECVANSCVQVGGAGVNRCSTNADCGGVCTGPGCGGCTGPDCGGGGGGGPTIHAACDAVQRACVNKAGGGPSTCASDPACSGSGLTHLACENSMCIIAGGAGENEGGCAVVGSSCLSAPTNGECAFTAKPSIVKKGDAATLTWSCKPGVTECSVVGTGINGGGSGSGAVRPAKTTQYTLSCKGATASTMASVYVVQSYDETNPGGR
jgi:hypothetical protein